MQKLEIVRSKINAVLARCESSIDAYYDKLYKSFAVDKHTTLVAHLYRNLSTETVEEYLALI